MVVRHNLEEKAVFKMKDKVGWSSQSGGYFTKKIGRIVGVIPPNCSPEQAIRVEAARYNASTAYGGGRRRKEESYLVLVESTGRNGKPRKPVLYWPLTQKLHKVM